MLLWSHRSKHLQILPAVLNTIPEGRFAAIDLEARCHVGLANINKFNSILIQENPKRQTHSNGRWTTFKTRIERPRYQLRSRGTPQAESFSHMQGCIVFDRVLHSRFLQLRAVRRKAQVFRPSIIAILKDWNFGLWEFPSEMSLLQSFSDPCRHSFTPNLLEHHLPLTLDLMVWVAATLASQFS